MQVKRINNYYSFRARISPKDINKKIIDVTKKIDTKINKIDNKINDNIDAKFYKYLDNPDDPTLKDRAKLSVTASSLADSSMLASSSGLTTSFDSWSIFSTIF